MISGRVPTTVTTYSLFKIAPFAYITFYRQRFRDFAGKANVVKSAGLRTPGCSLSPTGAIYALTYSLISSLTCSLSRTKDTRIPSPPSFTSQTVPDRPSLSCKGGDQVADSCPSSSLPLEQYLPGQNMTIHKSGIDKTRRHEEMRRGLFNVVVAGCSLPYKIHQRIKRTE